MSTTVIIVFVGTLNSANRNTSNRIFVSLVIEFKLLKLNCVRYARVFGRSPSDLSFLTEISETFGMTSFRKRVMSSLSRRSDAERKRSWSIGIVLPALHFEFVSWSRIKRGTRQRVPTTLFRVRCVKSLK